MNGGEMIWSLFLLADGAIADPFTGYSGWAGAGLLGMVLGWLLLVHLPAKDKMIASFQTDKDKHVADLIERYEKKLEDAQEKFEEALTRILNHCERETIRVGEMFRTEFAKIPRCRHDE